MVEKDEKLLADFEQKMRQLMFFCDSLKHENASLKREITKKEDSIKSLLLEKEQIKKRYDNLKLARSIANPNNSEERSVAKSKLSKLVQDIDKCIAMLKG